MKLDDPSFAIEPGAPGRQGARQLGDRLGERRLGPAGMGREDVRRIADHRQHALAPERLQGGGARVNDNKVEKEDQSANASDLTGDGYIKLSAGKKKHALVKIR